MGKNKPNAHSYIQAGQRQLLQKKKKGSIRSFLLGQTHRHERLTHLCGNFKLFNYSELKEHANAGFDEVKFCNGEVTEGEQVQVLSVDVVSDRAVCSLHKSHTEGAN